MAGAIAGTSVSFLLGLVVGFIPDLRLMAIGFAVSFCIAAAEALNVPGLAGSSLALLTLVGFPLAMAVGIFAGPRDR